MGKDCEEAITRGQPPCMWQVSCYYGNISEGSQAMSKIFRKRNSQRKADEKSSVPESLGDRDQSSDSYEQYRQEVLKKYVKTVKVYAGY